MTTDTRTDAAYYRSLTRRMILIIIAVSFTPLVLVSGIILQRFHTSYHEKVFDHLEELVQKHRQNIDNFLREKRANIRFLANAFSVAELSGDVFLMERLGALQQEFGPVFEDLGLVDAQGLQVAYAGPFKLGSAHYGEADWFKKALKSEHFISDVFLGLRGLPHFIVAVKCRWQEQDWILRATIDFMAFNTLVENLRVGKTGFAFILNRQGEFQTKPHTELVPDKEAYLQFLQAGRPTGHNVQITQKPDAEGQDTIYVSATLKGGDWLLVYQQNAADAFADLNRAQMIALGIMFIGGLGIVFTALLISRRMVGRIERADREKEMMNQQVIETGKLASVGELAAGIAHEINNPVAIMVEEAGWISDLLEEEDLRQSANLPEFERALAQIKTQGRRCKEITHKLLSFARKTDSRVKDFQANELIEDMVALSAQRAKYANVAIAHKLQPDLPPIRASHTEMQQVLLNLINNALDAMEKTGGSLTIATVLENNHVVIEVADNGPGIPQATLARIFDPFFTTKPVGKGTGLGLSICYGIIKKMGGAIDVRSGVGIGTTFRVSIPVTVPVTDPPAAAG